MASQGVQEFVVEAVTTAVSPTAPTTVSSLETFQSKDKVNMVTSYPTALTSQGPAAEMASQGVQEFVVEAVTTTVSPTTVSSLETFQSKDKVSMVTSYPAALTSQGPAAEDEDMNIGSVSDTEIIVHSENLVETICLPSSQSDLSGERPGVPSGILACEVCGDKGSGYHYSVFSCEGCKGFFKRSVQRNLVYSCKENQNCAINKYSRNNCQYCRFQRCLEVGMKKEAVREDRSPGGKHRHKRPRYDDLSGNFGLPNLQELNNKNLTTVIVPYEPVDNVLLDALVQSKPDHIPKADPPVEELESIDINCVMQYGYMELRYIIEWARKVTGFSDLVLEDQMALLKASFMELNVLRLAYRSMDCGGSVKFAEGLVLSSEDAIRIGWGIELINCTLDFVARLSDIQMDNTEFCILNAVILTYPDASGIQDKQAVMTLQGTMLECLRKYTISTYPGQPCRYGKILLRLPALRSISACAAERFLSMSLDSTIKMNALVMEMMS